MGGPDYVRCPLVDAKIENIDCMENADAVDGILKKEIAYRNSLKGKWDGKIFVKTVNGTIINTA